MRLIRREAVAADARSSFRLLDNHPTHWPFAWHHHPEVELTLIVRGQGMRFVGDSVEPFADGDLCLLGADLPHTWQSEPRPGRTVRTVVAQLPVGFPASEGMPELRLIADLLARAARGLAVEGATRAAAGAEMTAMAGLPAHSPRRLAGLIGVLGRLAESRELRPLASAAAAAAPADRRHDRRLAEVLAYIERSWRHQVAQPAAAAVAGLSPEAFSRFFRRAVGRTFVAHVAAVRIGHACRALIESDDEVADIAFACGFANLSNFNRAFRRLKRMTPSQYRALPQGGG